jgi:hypothetical protein
MLEVRRPGVERRTVMSCEHMVCASCAHPVAEGRCATCRASRSQLHQHGTPAYQVLVAAALLVVAFALLLAHSIGS